MLAWNLSSWMQRLLGMLQCALSEAGLQLATRCIGTPLVAETKLLVETDASARAIDIGREQQRERRGEELPIHPELGPSRLAELQCVVCLERPPTCVFEECGHLGVCGQCQRWLLVNQFNKNKIKKNQRSFEQLTNNMDKLQLVRVSCPCCRRITRVVSARTYGGVTFLI